MAGWWVKGSTRDCKRCEMLSDISSFQSGVNVKIAEAFECDTCDLTKMQPIIENEIIIELYDALPKNFDGMSGIRNVLASDIQFLFDVYEIPRELWEDYYNRLVFFHEQLLVHRNKKEKEKEKK